MPKTMSFKFIATLSLAFLGANFVFADPITSDIPGAADNPQLKRYEGAVIFQYSQKDFDEYAMAMGKGLNPALNDGKKSE